MAQNNMSGPNLSGANMTEADLTAINLMGADMNGANLTGANLTEANMTGADLTEANLTKADLTRTKVSLSQLRSAIGVTLKQIDSADIIPEEGEPVEPSPLNTDEAAEKNVIYKVVKVQIDSADFLIQTADIIRKRGAVNLTEEQDKALNDLLEIIKGLQEKVKDLEAERDELKSRLPEQWRSKLRDIAVAFPKGAAFAAGQEAVERITDREIIQELLSKATKTLQEILSSWLM